MKTQNQTDKSTARPWRARQWDNSISIDGENCAGIAFINPLKVSPTGETGAIPSAKDKANAALIVHAVNSHAALKAVADAAKYLRPALEPVPNIQLVKGLCAGCGNWTPAGHPEAHDHENNCPEIAKRSAIFGQREHDMRHGKRILDEALANLAAVEKGQQ